MRVNDVVRQAAVFIGYRDDPSNPDTEHLTGTAVLIGVDYGDILFRYLVTADHLVSTLPGGPPGLAKRKWPIARLFQRDGSSIVVNIPPDSVQPQCRGFGEIRSNWERHPTDTGVDAAATIIIPQPPWADREPGPLAYVPESQFIYERLFGPNALGIGDEVFVSGVFGYPGRKTLMSPILRTGNLAAIPNERIPAKRPYDSMECYLIESRSIGGLSGSPVFIRETISLGDDNARLTWRTEGKYAFGDFYFLGIMHGHWDIDPSDQNSVTPNPLENRSGGVNVGIAIVTPAQKIREILYCDRFVAERLDFVEALEEQN